MTTNKLPKWGTPKKAYTLSLNKEQAEILLEAVTPFSVLEDDELTELIEQLTHVTEGGK